MDHAEAISQARKVLVGDGGGARKRLLELWDKVAWRHSSVAFGSPAEASRLELSITLFSAPITEAGLLGAFGQLVAQRLSENAARRWEMKFVLPQPAHVAAFQQRLREAPHGASYRDLVTLSSNPVERLVAVHLANALIVNKLPTVSARNVDLAQWGPTAQFASGRRYYSLTPLVTAYAPRVVSEKFDVALADYARGFTSVSHTAVRRELTVLVDEVTAALS